MAEYQWTEEACSKPLTIGHRRDTQNVDKEKSVGQANLNKRSHGHKISSTSGQAEFVAQ
jgi:hypothetical protein